MVNADDSTENKLISTDGGDPTEDVPTSDGSSSDETEIVKPEFKRGVSFDKIEIREYARCLGNNPASTCGPPLSIDWDYVEVGEIGVEAYEETRPPRRCTDQMVVPERVREYIIYQHTDSTREEIDAVIQEVKKARSQRQMCVAMQDFDNLAVVFDTIKRRMKRIRKGVSKKREEEILWENARKLLGERTGNCVDSKEPDALSEESGNLTDPLSEEIAQE